jgi:hypothetical protein
VALAALRARVEVEEVLGGERVDERVADVGRLGACGERREPVARALVLYGHADGTHEHMHGLRERDGGDPEEREDTVHPPVREAGVVCRLAVEAQVDEGLPHEPADRRPDLEIRVVCGYAEGLEEEAGQREEEETPEENPVSEFVPLRLVP